MVCFPSALPRRAERARALQDDAVRLRQQRLAARAPRGSAPPRTPARTRRTRRRLPPRSPSPRPPRTRPECPAGTSSARRRRSRRRRRAPRTETPRRRRATARSPRRRRAPERRTAARARTASPAAAFSVFSVSDDGGASTSDATTATFAASMPQTLSRNATRRPRAARGRRRGARRRAERFGSGVRERRGRRIVEPADERDGRVARGEARRPASRRRPSR